MHCLHTHPAAELCTQYREELTWETGGELGAQLSISPPSPLSTHICTYTHTHTHTHTIPHPSAGELASETTGPGIFTTVCFTRIPLQLTKSSFAG